MNVFLEKQLALFPFSGSIYRSTWRLVTPPRVQVTVDTPVTSRELFRESVMQHRDIFAHFISQIKHICNFNIASHCSFDSINYACTRVVQLGYSEFVCGLGLRPPAHHVWSDIVSGAQDATKLRSEESNQGLLRRDAANQMHSKLPRRLFIPFLQSLPFNAKYGIKRTGGIYRQ